MLNVSNNVITLQSNHSVAGINLVNGAMMEQKGKDHMRSMIGYQLNLFLIIKHLIV